MSTSKTPSSTDLAEQRTQKPGISTKTPRQTSPRPSGSKAVRRATVASISPRASAQQQQRPPARLSGHFEADPSPGLPAGVCQDIQPPRGHSLVRPEALEALVESGLERAASEGEAQEAWGQRPALQTRSVSIDEFTRASNMVEVRLLRGRKDGERTEI